jgi:hypothetical protein
MKNSAHPAFVLDLNEDSDVLQWPIGRKMNQKLKTFLSQQMQKQQLLENLLLNSDTRKLL